MVDSNLEGFGVVQLGEVTCYASWKAIDGQVEIGFETRSLSLDKQRDLEHYRNSSEPIQFQLPGDRKPKSGIVVGYERNPRIAKFFVAPAKN